MTNEELKYYNELKKLSKRANQRLVRLEREFGKDSWGAKELKSLLDNEQLKGWTVTGRVKVNKSMDIETMQAIIKATEKFLKNKATSTVSGIKKIRKKQIENIKKSQANFNVDTGDFEDLSYSEAESLYSIFEDKNYQNISSYMKASEVWALISEAKENNMTKNQFLDNVKNYIDFGTDKDIKKSFEGIYNKYVK